MLLESLLLHQTLVYFFFLPTLLFFILAHHVFRKQGYSQHWRPDSVSLPAASFLIRLTPRRTLGYGTWQSGPGEVGQGVYEALKAGYRHLVCLHLIEATVATALQYANSGSLRI